MQRQATNRRSSARRLADGVALALSVAILAGIFRGYEKWSGLVDYARANLGRIMAQQERDFGIRFATSPRIKASMPAFIELRGRWNEGADYDTGAEVIYLNHRFNNYPARNLFARLLGRCQAVPEGNPVEDFLRHELGHHYANQLAKELGRDAALAEIFTHEAVFKRYHELRRACRAAPGAATRAEWDHFLRKYGRSLNALFGLKVIDEGLAEYFRKGAADRNTAVINWSRSLTEIGPGEEDLLVYLGGYKLVKPILARHGGRGVRALVSHPPAIASPAELPAYARGILEQLDREAGATPSA